jgi:hypothetical protein
VFLALFTGTAAGSSTVVFSHWLALIITLPLAVYSSWAVVRQRGIASAEGVAAVVGSLLICLNPVYNLLLDSKAVPELRVVTVLVNVLTWVGIVVSTAATIVSSRLHLYLGAWLSGKKEAPVCER